MFPDSLHRLLIAGRTNCLGIWVVATLRSFPKLLHGGHRTQKTFAPPEPRWLRYIGVIQLLLCGDGEQRTDGTIGGYRCPRALALAVAECLIQPCNIRSTSSTTRHDSHYEAVLYSFPNRERGISRLNAVAREGLAFGTSRMDALLEHTLLQVLPIVIQRGVTTSALIKVYGEGIIRAELCCYIVCQN